MRPACPVCQARFRGADTCTRCGASLLALQRCILLAFRHRAQAREELEGNPVLAADLARQAERLHHTPGGRSLLVLAAELAALAGGGPPAALQLPSAP